MTVLYVPVTQAKHAPLSSEERENPALHTHAVKVVLPLGDVVLSGQLEHDVSPAKFLNLPGAQRLHFQTSYPSSGSLEDSRKNPALHTQSLESVLMNPEVLFAGQIKHRLFPIVSVYVPAGHGVHAWKFPENPRLHEQYDAPFITEVELPGQL